MNLFFSYTYYLRFRLVHIHTRVHSPLALNYLGEDGGDVCSNNILISLNNPRGFTLDFHCWSRCI